MKSSDEEYLDNLLKSAKSNKNPQSALSRMSSKSNDEEPDELLDSESGDISALIDNSTGNDQIREVGELIDKADRDELIDDALANLLDDIQKPSDPNIPKFTVGNEPTEDSVRDAEEIALDEAIADAEKTDADRQNDISENSEENQDTIVIPDVAETVPIIDDSETVDALLEMAPEVDLPEENNIITDKDSDADQTPEEILTDLLDDMPGGNLMDSQNQQESSLSDIIDRERNAEEDLNNSSVDGIDLQSLDDMSINETEETSDGDPDQSDADSDEISLQELVSDEASEAEEPSKTNESVTEDNISELEDLLNMGEIVDSADGDMGSTSEGGAGASGDDAGEALPESESTAISAEDDINVTATDLGFIEEDDRHSPVGLNDISEDDINLNDLEANLDELLGGMNESYDTTEGEVAKILGDEPQGVSSEESIQDSGDVSMPELDALMNSLANDEVESLENTAHLDQELVPEDEDINKQDLLDALTETGFDDIGTDVSLDAISALPDIDSPEQVDSVESHKHKRHRSHREGFFKRLFRTLTEEDDDPDDVGTEGLASLTDENQQVIAELGEAEAKKKKKKKEKAKKPPKEKKPKKEKPKKEKPPKQKKEKKPKVPQEQEVREKAISPKKVMVAGTFAASLGILVCIPALILPVKISSERAKEAYIHSDFTNTYKLLHGKTMTTEQKTMYERARILAWADRYIKGYENYKAMNKEVEALDMLLMSERNKQSLLEEATKFNVEIQVSSVYDSIESLLSEEYGLSEEEINEINSIKKDRDYTIRVMEILGLFEN